MVQIQERGLYSFMVFLSYSKAEPETGRCSPSKQHKLGDGAVRPKKDTCFMPGGGLLVRPSTLLRCWGCEQPPSGFDSQFRRFILYFGGVAQLARAVALKATGRVVTLLRRFESGLHRFLVRRGSDPALVKGAELETPWLRYCLVCSTHISSVQKHITIC